MTILKPARLVLRRANAIWLIGGAWFDSVHFALARDDWARRS